eukprot:Gb_24976 [translate_table: standard]
MTKSSVSSLERTSHWIESRRAQQLPNFVDVLQWQNVIQNIVLRGMRIQSMEAGRILCTFKVPSRLVDGGGELRAGALATLIDVIGGSAIISSDGRLQLSAELNISFLSPAKVDDELEIDARVCGHKGGLSTAVVEVKKKANGELIAHSRLWANKLPTKEADRLSKM